MKKPPFPPFAPGPRPAAPPPGQRSGRGTSSIVPFLSDDRESKPVPLESVPEAPRPRRRIFWRG